MMLGGVVGRVALLCTVFALLLPSVAATDVEITSVSTPSDVRAGEDIELRATLENAGDDRITNATVTVDAWEQRTRSDSVEIAPGARETVPIVFTVPLDASGAETVQFDARAVGADNVIDHDIRTTPVTVTELHITIQVSPKTVSVGEQVTVSGQMSSRNVEASLHVGGQFEATVRSGDQGYYEHVFAPEKSGTVAVEVAAGGTTASTLLDVRPHIAVDGVTVPNTVNTDQRFELCADIVRSSTGAVALDLIVDDAVVQTRTVTMQDRRTVCFPHVLSEEGTHTMTLQASSGGRTAAGHATVEAVPATIAVQVFPDTLTVKQGAAGIFEIGVTNNAAETQHLTVDVTGLENTTTRLTAHDLTLETGASERVYLRILSKDLGTHEGAITVSRDGTIIAERPVTVRTAANPPLQSGPLSGLGSSINSAADAAVQYGVPLLTVVTILLLIVLYRRHQRSRTALQPRR